MKAMQTRVLGMLIAALSLLAAPASAITIKLDYTYDMPANGGSNFFGAGNPQGAGNQARAALEAAAGFFSTILNDSFSAIQSPAPFHSSVFNGVMTWQWTMNFSHPSLNTPIVRTNQTVPANEYTIFAGARNIPGSTLGVGGPGGYGWSAVPTGSFTNAEITQINQTTDTFQDAVVHRGQSGGFARWGGAIAFDSAPNSPWHYNHTTPVQAGRNDFYSVAIHELAHALGFGSSDAWNNLVSSSFFVGSSASAKHGSFPPLHTDGNHWAEGTMSVVYGSSTPQEAAMDPTLTTGTRKRFTELDAAALTDIGWSVIPLPPLIGDYNASGIVDAADYTLWRDTLGRTVPAGTGADGSGNGRVGPEDYTLWKSNFGATRAAGTSLAVTSQSIVPEPVTLSLLLAASVTLFCRPRSARTRI